MEIIKLITRTVDCSSLHANEFAQMMIEDMINARKKYDEIFYPQEFARHQKRAQEIKDLTRRRAVAYAEKKWKTQKKRDEYIKKVIDNYKESPFRYYSISFFDFDVEPLLNGISIDCQLEYSDLTEEAMIRCFNRIKDNKYFRVAQGWILEDHHYSRPQIKLILPEDAKAQFKEDEETLSRAIESFYEGATYFGD